ncbi:MAG: acyl-ACP--UDP-N-acetylglucosamine O-acyltransferase [Acidobacteriota bacterium]
MSSRRIHPTAIVDPGAELADHVEIGPYCMVGSRVRLGPGCCLESHVVLAGETSIGADCRFSPFSSIGGRPQDLKFKGELTRLEIGSRNVFRESITIHVGTRGGGGVTRIGDDNYFMAYVHVAHDCDIGNRTLLANAATLAGHVLVEDRATIGAYSGVHQFCRIGRQAFIGGYSVITRDALPYVLTVGNRAASHGINVIGLRRGHMPEETIQCLRRAYRILFRSRLTRARALERVEEEMGGVEEIAVMIRFVRESSRGIVT